MKNDELYKLYNEHDILEVKYEKLLLELHELSEDSQIKRQFINFALDEIACQINKIEKQIESYAVS